MKAKRRQFRQELLPATLRHAFEKIAGYRAHWGDSDWSNVGIDNLSSLPMTSKTLFATDPDSFRDQALITAALQHTGGTTKQPLIMQRCAEELKFIHDFFSAVIAEAPLGQSPLCISVLGNFHGDPTPMPYPGPTFRLDVNDTYWDLPTLLAHPTEFIGRPIQDIILVGLESQLRVLTCRLVESGFDFGSSVVRSVHSTGDLVTSRLKQFYESTWGCPLSSRYSMSEIVGGAELCRSCGYYHCDTQLIGEVVNAATGEAINHGTGILVLTSLFPFVQKQPMIRYRTGDVVRLGPRTCDVDELSFQLCGREMHTVFDHHASGEPVLIGAELYDIIDGIPDVALSDFKEMFKSITGLSNHQDLGHPKYSVISRVQAGQLLIEVNLELRYLPYLYPERADEVRATLYKDILLRHSNLKKLILNKEIELKIEFSLPGILDQIQIDETE